MSGMVFDPVIDYPYICINIYTVESRFATVRFAMIHFYDPCQVGPSTPNLWCILSLLSALLSLFRCACVSFLFLF